MADRQSRRGSDISAKEQEFLWHGRLPVGHGAVFAGAPGKGKSTLGYRVAADIDLPTIFVTSEEVDASVWRPRIEAAGIDPAKAFHHKEVLFSSDRADLNHLAGLIEEYKARLVVVDPIQNHLAAHVSADVAVRRIMEPYLDLFQEKRVALLMQAHVLRAVDAKASPLLAIPGGLRTWVKAAYLFAGDPAMDADPNMSILATADRFSFGEHPASRRFEYGTRDISVSGVRGGRKLKSYGYWIDRGETKVSAKTLLVTLAPESKDRKHDRVGFILFNLLREGAKTVAEIRAAVAAEDPPISWRTVERVAKSMEIEVVDDPKDARRKVWKLIGLSAETADLADEGDDLVVEEVEQPGDTFPEEWTGEDGEGA